MFNLQSYPSWVATHNFQKRWKHQSMHKIYYLTVVYAIRDTSKKLSKKARVISYNDRFLLKWQVDFQQAFKPNFNHGSFFIAQNTFTNWKIDELAVSTDSHHEAPAIFFSLGLDSLLIWNWYYFCQSVSQDNSLGQRKERRWCSNVCQEKKVGLIATTSITNVQSLKVSYAVKYYYNIVSMLRREHVMTFGELFSNITLKVFYSL